MGVNTAELPQRPSKGKSAGKKLTTNRNKERTVTEEATKLGLKTDLDLHGQQVGVYIGNRQNKVIAEGIIRAYNGRPRILNGSTKSRKRIK